MDPASVVMGVVSGAAGLAALAISTTTYLIGLKDSYKHVELVVLDLVTTCQAFEIAWRRIHDWAQGHMCQSADADPIFAELLAYHENSKIVLGALHSDLLLLEVNPKTTWRLSPKSKARTVLHEKDLKGHCDRLNRQISSLNLLLSAAKLTSPKIQEVVLDILQPVFRKDEESAWTIVNSQVHKSRLSIKAETSTWGPGSSAFTRSNMSSTAVLDNQPSDNKRFDFENDLILGPVYKRVLFAQLCKMPTISEAPLKDNIWPSTQTSPNQRKEAANEAPGQSESESEPAARLTSINGEDWSPENIVRILRVCGGFSIGVVIDLEELRRAKDGFGLPKRSLPLGSILKQNELVSAGQAFVNAKLILGATMDDADQVAQALDEGAEINATSEEGHTALQISLGESQTSTAAALILLYNETKVHLRDETGDTLLHYAMKSGNVSLIRRLVTSIDDLRVFDRDGATPLHVAARGGVNGLNSLREINRKLASDEVCADRVIDQGGRSALHIAAQGGHSEHALELLRLGCDPSFIPRSTNRLQEAQVPSSPLYVAVAAGHIDFVKTILEQCSERLDLVNWKHHIRYTLLDCARDSQLNQRYALVELLISHGADWRQTWRLNDRLLEFANTGSTPKLLLTLISQGCFPMQRDLDITPSLHSLQDDSNKELAAIALYNLDSPKSSEENHGFRLSFYARLGNVSRGGRSAFTERLNLREILEHIILGKANVALTHGKHPIDTLIPAKFALQASPVALGQAFYHMDRHMLSDTRKATHEAGAKQHILSIFGHNKALRDSALT